MPWGAVAGKVLEGCLFGRELVFLNTKSNLVWCIISQFAGLEADAGFLSFESVGKSEYFAAI